MEQGLTIVRMSGGSGKSFTPEENARIRAGARQLLARPGQSHTSVAKRLGIAQPTFSSFVRAEHPTGAGMRMARAIARELGITPDELCSGQRAPGATRYCDLADWTPSVEDAQRTYGDQLPAYAWKRAGLLPAPRNARLNAVTVWGLTFGHWQTMSDEERGEAARAQAEAEMAREDEEALAVPTPPKAKRSGSTRAATPRAASGRKN